jgi:hypothetical protein
MMSDYRTKQAGDVLVLRAELPEAAAGYYVLLDPKSTPVRLCLVGEDLETGQLVATAEVVAVEPADLSIFEPTGISAQIDAAPATLMSVEPGDIVEPLFSSADVPTGLYQVIESDSTWTDLSRLHSNEDGKLATTGRTARIASSNLCAYRRLHVADDRRA